MTEQIKPILQHKIDDIHQRASITLQSNWATSAEKIHELEELLEMSLIDFVMSVGYIKSEDFDYSTLQMLADKIYGLDYNEIAKQLKDQNISLEDFLLSNLINNFDSYSSHSSYFNNDKKIDDSVIIEFLHEEDFISVLHAIPTKIKQSLLQSVNWNSVDDDGYSPFLRILASQAPDLLELIPKSTRLELIKSQAQLQTHGFEWNMLFIYLSNHKTINFSEEEILTLIDNTNFEQTSKQGNNAAYYLFEYGDWGELSKTVIDKVISSCNYSEPWTVRNPIRKITPLSRMIEQGFLNKLSETQLLDIINKSDLNFRNTRLLASQNTTENKEQKILISLLEHNIPNLPDSALQLIIQKTSIDINDLDQIAKIKDIPSNLLIMIAEQALRELSTEDLLRFVVDSIDNKSLLNGSSEPLELELLIMANLPKDTKIAGVVNEYILQLNNFALKSNNEAYIQLYSKDSLLLTSLSIEHLIILNQKIPSKIFSGIINNYELNISNTISKEEASSLAEMFESNESFGNLSLLKLMRAMQSDNISQAIELLDKDENLINIIQKRNLTPHLINQSIITCSPVIKAFVEPKYLTDLTADNCEQILNNIIPLAKNNKTYIQSEPLKEIIKHITSKFYDNIDVDKDKIIPLAILVEDYQLFNKLLDNNPPTSSDFAHILQDINTIKNEDTKRIFLTTLFKYNTGISLKANINYLKEIQENNPNIFSDSEIQDILIKTWHLQDNNKLDFIESVSAVFGTEFTLKMHNSMLKFLLENKNNTEPRPPSILIGEMAKIAILSSKPISEINQTLMQLSDKDPELAKLYAYNLLFHSNKKNSNLDVGDSYLLELVDSIFDILPSNESLQPFLDEIPKSRTDILAFLKIKSNPTWDKEKIQLVSKHPHIISFLPSFDNISIDMAEQIIKANPLSIQFMGEQVLNNVKMVNIAISGCTNNEDKNTIFKHIGSFIKQELALTPENFEKVIDDSAPGSILNPFKNSRAKKIQEAIDVSLRVSEKNKINTDTITELIGDTSNQELKKHLSSLLDKLKELKKNGIQDADSMSLAELNRSLNSLPKKIKIFNKASDDGANDEVLKLITDEIASISAKCDNIINHSQNNAKDKATAILEAGKEFKNLSKSIDTTEPTNTTDNTR